MASADRAIGFGRGFNAERDKLRQQHIQDDQIVDQKSELAHSRARRLVTEARDDEGYRQAQAERPLRNRALEAQVGAAELGLSDARTTSKYRDEDRPAQLEARKMESEKAKGELADSQLLRDTKRKDLAKQAESEGMRMLVESLNTNADPRLIEQRFNQVGSWKIKPGTLSYDPTTKRVSFQGAGGQRFDGTTSQLMSIFGQKGAQELIKGDRDTVFYDKNGRPVAGAGISGNGPSGGRKISPFNPEGYSDDASKGVGQYFSGTYDPNARLWTFDPATRDKALYGMSLAGSLARHFGTIEGGKGERVSPSEISSVAGNIAANIPTMKDAEGTATKELGRGATPEKVSARAKEIVRAAKVSAAQELNDWTQRMEDALAKTGEKEGNGASSGNEVNWNDLSN